MWTVVGLPGVVIAAVVGACGVMLLLPGAEPGPRSSPWVERYSPWIVLVWFVPVVTMPVPPGADMAMHVALARGIATGSEFLSPAWGNVTAAVYPLGLSAWVAVLSPLLGFAAAGLVATGGVYALFTLGLRTFLRDVVGAPYPGLLSALCVLLAKSPQSFFSWGGNPTILAIALALFAASVISRYGEGTALRTGAIALLLAFGAAATHPIGAAVGATAIAASAVVALVRARKLTPEVVRRLGGCAMAGAGLLAAYGILRMFGPRFSDVEVAWVRTWGTEHEGLLPGPWWMFPVGIWRIFPEVLGDAYVITLVVAALVLLRTRGGRTCCLWIVVAVMIVGGIMALGPWVPSLGVFFFPARFTPLLAVATCPLLESAARDLLQRSRRIGVGLVVVVFGVAFVRHVRVFQSAPPMATRADVEVIRCLDTEVPSMAVIKGVYGDATQWIPALAGREVTQPHAHISLNDEIDEWRTNLKPTHHFTGEVVRYGPPAQRPAIPERDIICASGEAVLYVLP